MADIFNFNDPIRYLAETIKEKSSQRGFIAQMAEAAGCQRSYYSQALRGRVQLSPDHAMGLSEFLGHSNLEKEFFLNLLLISRAGTQRLKEHLEKKNKSLIESQSSVTSRVQWADQSKKVLPLEYYSSWLYMAVHMAVTVEKYANPKAIAKRFNIAESKIMEVLSLLEKHGLVRKINGQWTLEAVASHLPSESVMTFLNHNNWRQRAMVDVEKNSPESSHFTSVFSVSLEDAQSIKKESLKLVEKSRKIIAPSPSEEVFCLLLDFFKP